MDAADFWTSSPAPQGGAETQEMLLKRAGVANFQKAKIIYLQKLNKKGNHRPHMGPARKASVHSEFLLLPSKPTDA